MRRAVRQTVSRRDKAKVLMSENASNIPLDDDDILDLTVVAEPGKPAAPKKDAFAGPGGPADFGADLDALLDSLGADGSVTASASPRGPATPTAQAAPIADQTPVDHAVDPDEKMAMPEMSDIDSLLAELGVDVPAPAQPEAEPAAPKAPAAPLPEFDALLAQAQKAEAEKLAADAPCLAEPAPQATPATAPGNTMGNPSEEGGGDIDQKLDALLDDMMAIAPESGAVSAPKPATALPTVVKATVIRVPDQALRSPSEDLAALVDRVARLETATGLSALTERVQALEDAPGVASLVEQMQALDVSTDLAVLTERVQVLEMSADLSALTGRVQALEDAPAPAPQVETTQPAEAVMELSSLEERLQKVEESVNILESSELTESMIDGFIDAKLHTAIETLFAPDSPVMDRVCAELRKRIAAGELNDSLEKMAAAAAAKVIREEIAVLIEEG